MPEEKSLSQLTRSLMMGVSVGTIALTQVGCTAPAGYGGQRAGGAPQVSSEGEERLCNRALETRAASDVNALLVAYPSSRCIVPLLNTLPASTLGSLSVSALTGLSPSVRRAIPTRIRSQLPAQFVAVAQRPQRDDDDDGDSS